MMYSKKKMTKKEASRLGKTKLADIQR